MAYNTIAAVPCKPFARISAPRASITHFPIDDSASAVYTVDDSYSDTATVLDPYSTDLIDLREQVFSLQEDHVFSPNLINTARFGFSRAGYFFTGEPTPGTPAAGVTPFLSRVPRRSSSCRWQSGLQSADATGPGRKQQRQQPTHRPESLHL